ncbi:HEAT [Macleaya cordata]|uniref:HEAT n=1 Tax=Macleaya cordata TaxID=56857 RepID=A0A200Q0H2_MACCD|nr:HEAT [Macleaya cordata]
MESSADPQPQLTGVVIITLPPADDPSKGKTITSIFTLSDHPPHSSTLPQQSQETQLPIQSTTPEPEHRFNSFSRLFFGSPSRVLGLLGLSVLGLLMWTSYSSVSTFNELRSSEDDNREFDSFIFTLHHKFTNSDRFQRDVEFKLGKFVEGEKVMSSVAMIDDGIEHQKVNKLASYSSVADSSTIFPVKGNVYPHGLYYISMLVGNPPRAYYLDMDTGSDLTWIQCDAPCKSCAKGPHPLYKPTKGNILPSKDKLCVQVQNSHDRGSCGSCQQCNYEIEYADQSSSVGILARDNLQLLIANGTVVKPNFVLGCAYDQQGQLSISPARTDGILGISRAAISLPSQLASQGVIRNVVGHCIGINAGIDGYMFLGDEPVPQWGMTWVPMLNIPSIDLYHTEIVKMSYGGGQLSLGEPEKRAGRVIFDSGSSYTYFTNKAYSDLIASLEDVSHEGLVQDVTDPTLPLCWRAKLPIRSLKDVKAFFKPLTFHFGSRLWIISSKMLIPPEGYLIISNKGNVCLGILDGSDFLDESTIILGDISLRGQLVVYDNVNQKIGWVQSDCEGPPKMYNVNPSILKEKQTAIKNCDIVTPCLHPPCQGDDSKIEFFSKDDYHGLVGWSLGDVLSTIPILCVPSSRHIMGCIFTEDNASLIRIPDHDEMLNVESSLGASKASGPIRLSTIARALGEERTRKELIPFLSENNDDDDEVLLAMAEELGVFIPYVGGVEYAHVLLPPLETLCTVEETCVRDKAVESLCRIGAQMKESDLVDWFIPLVKRLASGEWFTARVSSCGLFHIAYPSAPEMLKTELRSIYSQLCQDDMPMVRRSAASNLGKFAATVEPAHLKTDVMSIFEDLTQDDQDSVRLLAVEGCAALGKLLEPQDCVAHILPVIVNFSQDKSWRVRYMVANQLYELCEAVGPEPTKTDLVPAYVRLLRDNEAEVRIAAAGKVTKFCRILNPQLAIQHILPCVKELSSDSSQHVRSALASVIMGMAPVLGKDATIEQLLPIFLSLLKDEFPDVRLNIISKLDQVNQVIGIDLLSQSLLPAIVELAEDRHWRVRLAIIEYIPLLASQLGVGFFDDKLGALCMQWLEDKVYSIRDAAANNLKRLAEEFGPDWAMQHIIPQVLEMIKNPHYLYRMTIIHAISLLAPVMGSEITCSKLLPLVINASKDRVPNIKFNVAKVLQSLIPIVDQSVVEQTIRPCLAELSDDPDVDVRFFASQALQASDQVMMSS